MKLLIAGCGYVGTALGQELTKSGHEVWGIRRDPAALRFLEENTRIKPIQADLLSSDLIKKTPSVEYVLICQSPSKKNDEYLSTYFQATKNLLKVLSRNELRKVILISSTSVYATQDGSWVDERTEPMAQNHGDRESQENAKVLLETESLVLNGGFPGLVLRLSGIYGEGRNRVKSLQDGRVKPVFSDVFMNRIHVTDIVRALRLLLDKGKVGELYLGSDDRPSTQKEFYGWVFEKLGLPIPTSTDQAQENRHGQSNKRVSNKKLKDLGLQLRFPSFKEGYTPLIASTQHA